MAFATAYGQAEHWDAANAMMLCASKQGHGPAAHQLAIYAKVEGRYFDALDLYHAGARFGHEESASSLRIFFDPALWANRSKAQKDERRRLRLKPDGERARRYSEIAEALAVNPDLRLTRLNLAVPHPPADLPPWGSITDTVEPESDKPPTY